MQNCLYRPYPGVHDRKAPWFLHWCQHTQYVHCLQAFPQLQAWLYGTIFEQVEFWMQLQH